ncbi:MAG: VapC toxin family PIN domain ribonuclease [Gemmatimonadetes bacterium]|nr:VapC toxin family PIN domain ribonuclease [Gemmatimonadota bacterium]
MILVDSSVWIGHIASANPRLSSLLADRLVLTHPFVAGEVACGTMKRRVEILGHMGQLPEAPIAGHAEVMALVERQHLAGSGLGWVDVHLLASTLIGSASLWSADGALRRAAQRLKVALL